MGDIVYGDKYGGDNVYGDKYEKHETHHANPSRVAPPERRVILVLSANAVGQPALRLDDERRAIDHAVAYSRMESRLEVRTADAVRIDDLQTQMLRHRPVVAHFCGHGRRQDGIQVLDERGRAQSVPPPALRDLFRILSDGLRCVVLNACHTDEQAEAIAAHIPYVVGMRRAVFDDDAVRFATGFYRGIAGGTSVRTSFELGCNYLDLHGVPESDVPRLFVRPGEADGPLIEPA